MFPSTTPCSACRCKAATFCSRVNEARESDDDYGGDDDDCADVVEDDDHGNNDDDNAFIALVNSIFVYFSRDRLASIYLSRLFAKMHGVVTC